jgi:hypothetical protein
MIKYAVRVDGYQFCETQYYGLSEAMSLAKQRANEYPGKEISIYKQVAVVKAHIQPVVVEMLK